MNVLVLNCGSSSVKFRLIATDPDLIAQNADRRLAKGTIERIGGEAIIRLQVEGHEPPSWSITLLLAVLLLLLLVRGGLFRSSMG